MTVELCLKDSFAEMLSTEKYMIFSHDMCM